MPLRKQWEKFFNPQKIALDKLAQRLQKFHEKLTEASALSTGPLTSHSQSNFDGEKCLIFLQGKITPKDIVEYTSDNLK